MRPTVIRSMSGYPTLILVSTLQNHFRNIFIHFSTLSKICSLPLIRWSLRAVLHRIRRYINCAMGWCGCRWHTLQHRNKWYVHFRNLSSKLTNGLFISKNDIETLDWNWFCRKLVATGLLTQTQQRINAVFAEETVKHALPFKVNSTKKWM